MKGKILNALVYLFLLGIFGSMVLFLVTNRQLGNSLQEGRFKSISSDYDVGKSRTELVVEIEDYVSGRWVTKRVTLNSIPQNIQFNDRVKIITLPNGELTFEKIIDLKGDPK